MGHTCTLVVVVLASLQGLVVVPVTSILNMPGKSNLRANKGCTLFYQMLPPTWPTFLTEISHILAVPMHKARVSSFNMVGGRSCQEAHPQYTKLYTLDSR